MPGAYFYPEAMFELGRSYVRSGDVEKASGCYDRLIREVKDSTFVARSLIELGMIARNKGEYELSLSRYKTVVEKMPLSGLCGRCPACDRVHLPVDERAEEIP